MMDNQDNSVGCGSALVVDDDPEMRRMLGLVLKRGGFAVELAGGGEEALVKIAAGVPTIVVTDLHMPGMNGVELLAKVREQHRDLPIIVLTGSGGIASAVEAMRAGAEDFLTKPIDPAALRFAVDRAIERTKQRAETDLLR